MTNQHLSQNNYISKGGIFVMKKKGIIGIVAAMAMAASLCGCGGNSGTPETTAATTAATTGQSNQKETSGTTAATETTTAAKAVEKPATISWWTHSGLNEEDYVKEWDAKFDELTGIHLEHTQVSNNESGELLEVAFASGTEPNVFDLSCDQKVAYYASQGAIADLTDLVKSSGLYDKIDPSIWESISVNGRIYGIPAEMPSGVINYARQDWLEQLGMEAPKNYEDYINMLRGFRDNIDQCTIPLTAPGLHNSMNLPEFYWSADTDFTYVDGKWVDGMMQDNFVDAMQRLQDAYAEGLIDTEIVTNTTSACRDKWYSGEAGVFSYWGGKWGKTLRDRLKENFPDAELVGLDAIEESYYRYTAFNLYCIDGRLSEKEVEQIFTYFTNYVFGGGEGQELFYCGVEGLHHEKDANGVMNYLKMKSNEESTFQSVWGTPWLAVAPFDNPDKVPQPDEMVTSTLGTLAKTGVYKGTTPSSQTLNMITSDLLAIRQETIAKIVMGTLDVQEGMDNYKRQATALGIEQVLEEMNQ